MPTELSTGHRTSQHFSRQTFIRFPGLREFAVKIASKFYDSISLGYDLAISNSSIITNWTSQHQHKWPATRIITWPLCVLRRRGMDVSWYHREDREGERRRCGQVAWTSIHPSEGEEESLSMDGCLPRNLRLGLDWRLRGRIIILWTGEETTFPGNIEKLCITLKVVLGNSRRCAGAPLWPIVSSLLLLLVVLLCRIYCIVQVGTSTRNTRCWWKDWRRREMVLYRDSSSLVMVVHVKVLHQILEWDVSSCSCPTKEEFQLLPKHIVQEVCWYSKYVLVYAFY